MPTPGPTRPRARWLGLACATAALAGAAALLLAPRTPEPTTLTVTYPLDGAVFPPEIPPPAVRWVDDNRTVNRWRVAVSFADGGRRLTAVTDEPRWRPSPEQWAAVKSRSVEQDATVSVTGVDRADPDAGLTTGSVRVRTSRDPVGAPLFYREVNLPFVEAVKDPSYIRWRFGTIDSPPPVVLRNLPVCGNCHSFSADGSVMGMDVDYANDKGSYAIAEVKPHIVLNDSNIITWMDYKREDEDLTFGLLSQISPNGRYAISTVKDRSVFVPTPGLMYSQLFFPVRGILAFYDRRTKAFAALPGADDPQYVQSNPAWSPDGQTVVFTRARAHQLRNVGDKVLLTAEDCREFLKEGKTFRFDLYRVPFNDGAGGRAEPLAGASANGASNYFPKYSPDGKWIVFCRAASFSLLQPDSRLHIVPAAGGRARPLRCNLEHMNSWHSWSPNSKWLVFSSKQNGPFTQLWLTHIDDQGRSAPPVVLDHLTAPDRAANIPEFVPAPATAIASIRERFLDDYSFARAAREFLKVGDLANAERQYRQGLERNPRSAGALVDLARILVLTGRDEQAFDMLRKAIEYEPKQATPRFNLGILLVERGKSEEGAKHLRGALRLKPDDADAHRWLGRSLADRGRHGKAVEQFREAIRLAPRDVDAYLRLAQSLLQTRRVREAIDVYYRLLQVDPNCVPGLVGLAWTLAGPDAGTARDGVQAVRLAQQACALTQNRDPSALVALAAGYAAAGQHPQAVRTARQALRFAQTAGDANLAAQANALLARYRQPSAHPGAAGR